MRCVWWGMRFHPTCHLIVVSFGEYIQFIIGRVIDKFEAILLSPVSHVEYVKVLRSWVPTEHQVWLQGVLLHPWAIPLLRVECCWWVPWSRMVVLKFSNSKNLLCWATFLPILGKYYSRMQWSQFLIACIVLGFFFFFFFALFTTHLQKENVCTFSHWNFTAYPLYKYLRYLSCNL